MKRFITIVLGISLTFTSLMYAQDSITPEGVNEVIRRGNHIELIDGTQGSDLVGDAMAPPEDDSHKWFISVITSANCKYCELLKNDIINDKNLKAWINTSSPSKSFTHYNIYRIEDQTQSTWRFKNLKIKGVPTIVIQPPLNGEYGPNKTTVAQLTGYNGDAKALSDKIGQAITNYVKTLNQRKNVNSGNDEGYKSPAPEGFGQRQPRPEFLPPDPDKPNITPNDLIPPELEGLKPKVPSLPSFPSLPSLNTLGESPFFLMLGGLVQVFIGLISLIWNSVHTILMIVILVILVKLLASSTKSKSVENDQSTTNQS